MISSTSECNSCKTYLRERDIVADARLEELIYLFEQFWIGELVDLRATGHGHCLRGSVGVCKRNGRSFREKIWDSSHHRELVMMGAKSI